MSAPPPYHPAKYSDRFLPLFARLLQGTRHVLDPMAGTGKLGRIKAFGYAGRVVCNDLQPEWVTAAYGADEWYHADAAALAWCASHTFDAVCTSPTYGNRLADHHNARDGSRRHSYTHSLGKPLHPGNTGVLQWGDEYRAKHDAIWAEAKRVVARAGLLIVNVSNHIRRGQEVDVVGWHQASIARAGFHLRDCLWVPTHRLVQGSNAGLRVRAEAVLVFVAE